MSASCVGNQQALYQECLHHDQQTNIQTAVNHWRLVYCNATNATIFISPHLLLFESLSQVKEYVECFTGILCGLDYFISLLGQLPINRVGTERQFSELCSRLTKYGLKSASNLKELDEFLTNNKAASSTSNTSRCDDDIQERTDDGEGEISNVEAQSNKAFDLEARNNKIFNVEVSNKKDFDVESKEKKHVCEIPSSSISQFSDEEHFRLRSYSDSNIPDTPVSKTDTDQNTCHQVDEHLPTVTDLSMAFDFSNISTTNTIDNGNSNNHHHTPNRTDIDRDSPGVWEVKPCFVTLCNLEKLDKSSGSTSKKKRSKGALSPSSSRGLKSHYFSNVTKTKPSTTTCNSLNGQTSHRGHENTRCSSIPQTLISRSHSSNFQHRRLRKRSHRRGRECIEVKDSDSAITTNKIITVTDLPSEIILSTGTSDSKDNYNVQLCDNDISHRLIKMFEIVIEPLDISKTLLELEQKSWRVDESIKEDKLKPSSDEAEVDDDIKSSGYSDEESKPLIEFMNFADRVKLRRRRKANLTQNKNEDDASLQYKDSKVFKSEHTVGAVENNTLDVTSCLDADKAKADIPYRWQEEVKRLKDDEKPLIIDSNLSEMKERRKLLLEAKADTNPLEVPRTVDAEEENCKGDSIQLSGKKPLVELEELRIPSSLPKNSTTKMMMPPSPSIRRSTKTSPYFKNKSHISIDGRFSIKRTVNKPSAATNNKGPRGLHETIIYAPPLSPYNLIQEKLFTKPWQLLVATIFLNKTTGQAAIPIFWKFIALYNSPQQVLKANWNDIAELMQPLGLHERRAHNIIRFSEDYLHKVWKYPIELYGIGKYGNDSYRLFCLGQWKDIDPDDHKLNLYHEWLKNQYRSGMLFET